MKSRMVINIGKYWMNKMLIGKYKMLIAKDKMFISTNISPIYGICAMESVNKMYPISIISRNFHCSSLVSEEDSIETTNTETSEITNTETINSLSSEITVLSTLNEIFVCNSSDPKFINEDLFTLLTDNELLLLSLAIAKSSSKKGTYSGITQSKLDQIRASLIDSSFSFTTPTLFNNGNRKLRNTFCYTPYDSIVHHAMGSILLSVFEPVFFKQSFGFRGENTFVSNGALDSCTEYMKNNLNGSIYLINIDLSLSSDKDRYKSSVMETLHTKISDQKFLDLITKCLDHIDFEQFTYSSRSQSKDVAGLSALNPILSNILAHSLDIFLVGLRLNFIRYGNKVIIGVKSDLVESLKLVDQIRELSCSVGLHAHIDLVPTEESVWFCNSYISFDNYNQPKFFGGVQSITKKLIARKYCTTDMIPLPVTKYNDLSEVVIIARYKFIARELVSSLSHCDNFPKIRGLVLKVLRASLALTLVGKLGLTNVEELYSTYGYNLSFTDKSGETKDRFVNQGVIPLKGTSSVDTDTDTSETNTTSETTLDNTNTGNTSSDTDQTSSDIDQTSSDNDQDEVLDILSILPQHDLDSTIRNLKK